MIFCCYIVFKWFPLRSSLHDDAFNPEYYSFAESIILFFANFHSYYYSPGPDHTF